MQQATRYWIDEILVKSPFAEPLGLQVVAAEPDRVSLRLPFRAGLATVGTIVHGGAIATLIDVAGAAASASAITGDDAAGGATSTSRLLIWRRRTASTSRRRQLLRIAPAARLSPTCPCAMRKGR